MTPAAPVAGLREVLPGVWAHPTADVELPAQIGAGTRIWRFCHVMSGACVGREVSLGQGCFVAAGAVIGDRVRVQNQVSVFAGVQLDDEVFVGPGVVFTNVKNPRAFRPRQGDYTATRIARGATLGANATVLPGVLVGEYAFVGAGAVVTRGVPPHALVLGAPARVVGWVSVAGEALKFDAQGQARCPADGSEYRRVGSRVERR
jgi:UDP-2-acetamido-3-amino-2,3-dideoxy-glucuronate N-acetyltransferase